MKRSVYIFLICFFTVACNDKEKENIRIIPANKVIDATEINDVNFSTINIIDSSYFIHLETTDECLIKKIDKIVFDKNKIFVLDCGGNNKILVFDRHGKFMYTVGKIGQGTGEYRTACDFCLDVQNKMIYIICERSRIMQYNYNGDFVKQIKMDFYAENIEYSNKHFYFIGNQLDFYNLVITDSEIKIIDKFFPNKDWGDNFRILRHPLQKTDSIVYYFGFLDDNIYGIKNISEVFVQYRINFGKTKIGIPTSSVHKYKDDDLSDKIYSSRGAIRFWIQNSDYFICYYWDKENFSMNIYNKNTNVSQNYHDKNVIDRYIVKEGEVSIFEYLTDADELVSVVQPSSLLENIELIKNEDDKNYIKNMRLIEDMNPLLYVIKTK
jgi:hypothetical protein